MPIWKVSRVARKHRRFREQCEEIMAVPRIGKKVKLIPFQPEHAEALFAWYYDVTYQAFFREFPDRAVSLEDCRQFGEWLAAGGSTFYTIIDKNTEKPIGLMTYTCLKSKSGVYRFGIMLDEKHQGQAWAIESIMLLAYYLFEYRRCNKLVVEFLADNKHIQRISEQGGFVREGVLKNEAYIDGKYVDELRYSISKEKVCEVCGEYYAQLEEAEE